MAQLFEILHKKINFASNPKIIFAIYTPNPIFFLANCTPNPIFLHPSSRHYGEFCFS